jgi:chemotaxis protein MotB|tara:strand:- start:249205 stop:250209 length:1005 start_codon:yes stop_codon:yes gene_type:complete
MKKALLVLTVVSLMVACVPAKKYEDLKTKYNQTELAKQNLELEVQNLSAENKELKGRVNSLVSALEKMELDTIQKGRTLRRLEVQYNKINNLNTELLDKYAKLQQGSEIQFSRIMRELDGVKDELQKREDELNVLETELAAKRKDMQRMSDELDEREKKMRDLERLLSEEESAVKALQNQISDALLIYKDRGLSVERKNGKIYVSLAAKLLFKSGGTKVDTAGVRALVDVAKALENADDIEILVEGHTDDDDFQSPVSPKNNWELSVLRATSVVQILLANSSISPANLVPAGRGKFAPIDSMDKARNRRIEIILSPKLDKLYKMIETPENSGAN